MGMAASQVRLLQLTARKNDIGYQLQNLSLQKTSLSRDMQRVTKEYQNALSTKTLKWSNNSGVTYVDLSYANLMRPGSVNGNVPYLITNASGNVVVDSQYQKYAEMISADGSAGGFVRYRKEKNAYEVYRQDVPSAGYAVDIFAAGRFCVQSGGVSLSAVCRGFIRAGKRAGGNMRAGQVYHEGEKQTRLGGKSQSHRRDGELRQDKRKKYFVRHAV